jgi:hypothetical protein
MRYVEGRWLVRACSGYNLRVSACALLSNSRTYADETAFGIRSPESWLSVDFRL